MTLLNQKLEQLARVEADLAELQKRLDAQKLQHA